jgi:outer membrane autotransporter protein
MTLGALVNTGTIDFGSPANAAPAAPPGVTAAPSLDGYRTLAVSSLAGDGAFRMKIDLAAGKSDRLVVAGDATGTHRLLLTPAGADPAASPTGDETKLTLVQIAGVPAAGFPAEISGTALAFDGGFNQGAFNYIAQTAGGAVTIANNGLNSDAAAITGVPGAQSLLVLASQDNLGHRLGHFRAPDPELGDLWLSDRWEIWALARAARFSINAAAGTRASRLLSYGAELGADKTWRLAAERATLGLALGAGAAAQTFRGLPAGTSADGDSRQLTAAAYAAWVHNNGIFANATLAATRLSNTFSSTDQSANRTTASYADTALAATLEAGKRFNLNSAVDGCFLEPSASFTHLRLERSSYTTAGANLLSVRATGATVTRLRAALRAGRAWRLGAAGDRGYLELAARLAASRETSTGGEIRIGSDTWRPNLDGNRLEAGAGLIWSPRVNTRLHLDYDAACSRPCDKPWGITLGCHHLF